MYMIYKPKTKIVSVCHTDGAAWYKNGAINIGSFLNLKLSPQTAEFVIKYIMY